MRELVEHGLRDGRIDARAVGGRRVTVNLAESPLGWLRARGRVSARQFEAGERLRGDFERAGMGPRVTMDWSGAPRLQGTQGAHDQAAGGIAAKRRFDAAIAAAGPGLSDVLWRVVCAGEALPMAEKALGWPVRSGRLVLGLALDRVADGYGLPGESADEGAEVRPSTRP